MQVYTNDLPFNIFKLTIFFFNKSLELVIIFLFDILKLNSYIIMKLFHVFNLVQMVNYLQLEKEFVKMAKFVYMIYFMMEKEKIINY